MEFDFIESLRVQNELGEGIIWDSERQVFLWTDISQKKLYSYNLSTKEIVKWDTPERLCCFSRVSNSDKLVCAFESGFAFYAPETENIEWIQKIETSNPGTRLNDGRTDRVGRLWAGSMVEDSRTATRPAALYCLHGDLHVSRHLTGLSISNGLCWSPLGNIMYHADTMTQEIREYDFELESGACGNGRTLVKTPANCFPDGSIVDSEGYIWNAQWGGSRVVRYKPDGSEDSVIKLPTSQPTSIAFGGEKLDLIAITTAYSELNDSLRDQDWRAGDLFIFKSDIRGLQEKPFCLK